MVVSINDNDNDNKNDNSNKAYNDNNVASPEEGWRYLLLDRWSCLEGNSVGISLSDGINQGAYMRDRETRKERKREKEREKERERKETPGGGAHPKKVCVMGTIFNTLPAC